MDKIRDRIAEFPPEYGALVSGPIPGEIAVALAAQLGLTAAQAKILQQAVIFTMLFYFQKNDLVRYLKNNLEVSDSVAIATAESLVGLLPPEFPKHLHKNEPAPTVSQPTHTPTAPISEPAEAPPTLQSVRTMSSDMSRVEPTHQTSQDSILGQEDASTQDPDTPRWGSDAS
jgi:hypothetical protein